MKNHTRKCVRCGGKGRLEVFSHKDNGRCFACEGAGRIQVRKRESMQGHLDRMNEVIAENWPSSKCQSAQRCA